MINQNNFQGYVLVSGVRNDGGPGSGPQGGSGSHTIEESAREMMHRAGRGENIDQLMKEISDKHGIGQEHQHIIRKTLMHMQELSGRLNTRKFGMAYGS